MFDFLPNEKEFARVLDKVNFPELLSPGFVIGQGSDIDFSAKGSTMKIIFGLTKEVNLELTLFETDGLDSTVGCSVNMSYLDFPAFEKPHEIPFIENHRSIHLQIRTQIFLAYQAIQHFIPNDLLFNFEEKYPAITILKCRPKYKSFTNSL